MVLSKSFPQALAALLRSRGLQVPAGLLKAPPEAYAGLSADLVEQIGRSTDAQLASQAAHVAGYAKRQAQRAKAMWDDSPLIAELRRRKLAEPPRPKRFVAASPVTHKPLGEWSDAQIVAAATEWSRRASG